MPEILYYACGKTLSHEKEIDIYIQYLQLLSFLLAFAINLYIIFCYCFRRYKEPIQSHQFFVIVVSLHVLVITSVEFACFISLETGLIKYVSLNDPVVWLHRLDVPAATCFLAAYRRGCSIFYLAIIT